MGAGAQRAAVMRNKGWRIALKHLAMGRPLFLITSSILRHFSNVAYTCH